MFGLAAKEYRIVFYQSTCCRIHAYSNIGTQTNNSMNYIYSSFLMCAYVRVKCSHSIDSTVPSKQKWIRNCTANWHFFTRKQWIYPNMHSILCVIVYFREFSRYHRTLVKFMFCPRKGCCSKSNYFPHLDQFHKLLRKEFYVCFYHFIRFIHLWSVIFCLLLLPLYALN